MLHNVENIKEMGQYNCTEATWRVAVEMIEDTQKKLCVESLTEVQLNELIMGGGMMQLNSLRILKRRRQFCFLSSYLCIVLVNRFEVVNEESGICAQFVGTNEFGYYVDNGDLYDFVEVGFTLRLHGWLSVDKRLRSTRDAYMLRRRHMKALRIR
ncbi:hypothetical protein Cgig2_010416 [Carnegiea gigantea]|uniref:Uncharacterized protein n=1 Tax=Carnegiea gigantea TaxID=171969 RepID=A0A9Q1GW13_9CARY|nr:hypothetical protein Cgig2_010416 [Carnegiea gigantea]